MRGLAQQQAQQAQQVVQGKPRIPAVVVCGALAVLGLLILDGRQRKEEVG